jgi:acetyl/propionyl-CoA carboxylase alpha subunit
MTFEVEIGGRARRVTIDSVAEDRFRVTVDGTPRVVDARRVGEFGVSFIDVDAGVSHDALVAPGSAVGESHVWLDGQVGVAAIDGRRARRRPADRGAEGAQAILAPMPGRVVRLLVGPGDVVEARQPVIVVEAMKMENELRAPKAGRVTQVTVSEGAPVEAGRLLIVIG